MRILVMAALAAVALTCAGCGTTQSDRTLSGAGIGAVAGGVGSAVVGGSVGTGVVVGAVVGGVVGATTTKDDINLGTPLWRKKCEERRRNGERVDCSRRRR